MKISAVFGLVVCTILITGSTATAGQLIPNAAEELAAATLLSTSGDKGEAYRKLQYLEHTVPHCYDADLLNGHAYVWRLFDQAGWVVMEDDAIAATQADQGAAQAAKDAADVSLCSTIVLLFESHLVE